MKCLKLWGLLGLLPFLAGCTVVGSAHPLFTGKEAVENPPIAGTWEPDDTNLSLRSINLTSKGNGEYEISFTGEASDDSKKSQSWVFEAKIRRVGSQLLFDATFDKFVEGDTELSADDLFAFPMHFIGVLNLEGDKAMLQFPDGDWLEKAGDSGKVPTAFAQGMARGREKNPIPIVKENDYILLLAPDSELQAFILKHAGDKKAFPPSSFHRRK